MRWLRRSVEGWFAAFFLANFVMGMSSVLVPLKIDRILGLGPSQLGILSASSSLAAVVGSFLWGRLSDVAHRRRAFVVLSYVFVSASHVGLAVSESFLSMALASTFLSFFWVANASVAVLLVIERRDDAAWETSISALNLAGAMGWLGGLLIGGIVVGSPIRSMSPSTGMWILLMGLAVLAVVAAISARCLIPPTTPVFTQRRFRGMIVAIGNLLVEAWRFSPLHLYHRISLRRLSGLRRETRLLLLASALAFTGIGFFAVPLALTLSQRLGYSAPQVFYAYVMLHAGIVIAYPIALHRVKRLGNRRVQMSALGARALLFILGSLALWRIADPPWIASAFFLLLMGVTWSFFQLSGVALASRLAKPENRGLALGTYNAIAGACSAVAGLLSGYLVEHVGHHLAYASAAAFVCAAVIVLYRLPDALADSSDGRRAEGSGEPGRREQSGLGSAQGDEHASQ